MKHLIFYDAPCPLCNRAIRFILAADQRKDFFFAPLDGEMAKKMEVHARGLDTLVLIENWKSEKESRLVEGKAVCRIFWHLKGRWRLIGWLSFLPSVLFDLGYRAIARRRYNIFSKTQPIAPDPTRFLK